MNYVPIPERPLSILRAFLDICEQSPQRPCMRFEGQHYNYRHLYGAAAEWATRLRDAGLKPGERVGLFLGNSPAFVAAYLGVYLAGGCVVLINTQYRQTELRHILADSGARIGITDAERQTALATLQPDLPHLETVLVATDHDERLLLTDPATVPAVPAFVEHNAPDDLALLVYTSGTTGRSKGAMHTHSTLAANSAAITAAWRWTADDVLLLTLPLFHIHGLGVGIHGTFLSGASVDLCRRFDAAEVYDTLLSGSVTMFFGVPTMYTRLLAEARQRAQVPAPLRLYVSGSAPLDVQTFADFEQYFGTQILERYGMTETGMNLTNPYDGERRPGTVGQPFPGQEARIVDTHTRQPLPDETAGEIQVRGPHVCKGYWQRPDATAEVFGADGWLSTGDLGWRSTDGYYTISGRAKELIISGGYNVYPREIEEVLLTHAAVQETAVVGLPHTDLGEQVVAVIVSAQATTSGAAPRDGLHAADERLRRLAEELVEHCREHLAAYKKPRKILFVAALPRNALGKIQKHVLKSTLQTTTGKPE